MKKLGFIISMVGLMFCLSSVVNATAGQITVLAPAGTQVWSDVGGWHQIDMSTGTFTDVVTDGLVKYLYLSTAELSYHAFEASVTVSGGVITSFASIDVNTNLASSVWYQINGNTIACQRVIRVLAPAGTTVWSDFNGWHPIDMSTGTFTDIVTDGLVKYLYLSTAELGWHAFQAGVSVSGGVITNFESRDLNTNLLTDFWVQVDNNTILCRSITVTRTLSPTTVEARGECSFPVTLDVNINNPHGIWLIAVYIDGIPDPLTNGTLTISTGGTFYKPSTWGPQWADWPNFISWYKATTGSFTYTIDTSNIPVGTHVVDLLMGSQDHDSTPWDGDFIPVGSFTVVIGSRTAICAPAGVRITDNVSFDYVSNGTPQEFDVPPLVWRTIQGNAFNITGVWKWDDAFLWVDQGVILRGDSAPQWSLDGNTLTYTISQPISQGDFIISHPLYGQNKLLLDFDFTKIGIEQGMIGEVVLKMYSSTPSMIEERLVKPVYGQFRTIYNMNALSPGVYYLKIIVRNNQGIQLSKKYLREFSWWPAELGQFSWLGSTAGATDEVLAPWTPIGVGSLPDLTVNVWGRAYRFANSPFPTVIETKGKSILAAPVEVKAKVNGAIVSWVWSSYNIEQQTPSVVRFNQQASGQGLRLSAVTQIEYDGMMRIDWNVTADQPLTLEELTFEIPIQAIYAKYVYNQGHLGKSGSLPLAGWVTGFEPLVWLGDEELGLQWFCESEKDWYNVNATQCVEVLPQGNVVSLRLHLVDEVVNMTPGVRVDYGMGVPVMEPRTQVKELRYTFGLQVTPVKPVTKDVWDYRFAHLGTGAMGTGMTRGTGDRFNVPAATLDLVASDTKTVAYHQHWTDIYGSTSTPYETELRNMVTAWHSRGVNVLLYLGLLMSDISPEWTLFNEECLVGPRYNIFDFTNRPPMPSQYAYHVCNASVWQDIEVDGLARTMMGVPGYDIDGVFLDSPDVLYSGCKNYLHGCGFIDPNGNLIRRYPIFSNRQKMRRIYAVVKGRNPEGQVNLHNSTCVSIPTLSWATSYWNGEHLGYRMGVLRGATKTSPLLERLPLDQFRTEFMGHQWGVPAEFLEYAMTDNQREALAMTLLHDVGIRAHYLMAPILLLTDEFGRKASEWVPYWRNSGHVTLAPAGTDTYMSLYTHPTNGMLGVISNLSEFGDNVGVQLNLVNLNLVGATSAHVYEMMSDQNVLTENVIGVTNGYFTLNLPSRSWRLIWVKRQ